MPPIIGGNSLRHREEEETREITGEGGRQTVDQYGKTELHYASMMGNVDQALDLIIRGANINAQDNDGQTPLHCATIMKQQDMAAVLLEVGANPNIKDKYNLTPLDHANDLEIKHFLTHPEKIRTRAQKYWLKINEIKEKRLLQEERQQRKQRKKRRPHKKTTRGKPGLPPINEGEIDAEITGEGAARGGGARSVVEAAEALRDTGASRAENVEPSSRGPTPPQRHRSRKKGLFGCLPFGR